MKILASIVLGLLLLLSGFLIGVLTISSVTDSEPETKRTEITVLPEYRSLVLNNRYDGTVTDVYQRQLIAPRAGTITEIFSSNLADGAPALELDAVPFIAAVSEVPFWRDLKPGTEGPDVENLERFLTRLGHLDPSEIDHSYDEQTELAIEQWRDRSGIPVEFNPGPSTLFAIPPDTRFRFEPARHVGDYLFEHDVIGRIIGVEREIIVSIPVADLSEINLPASVDWRLPGSTISGFGNLVALDDEITVANSGLLVQMGNVEIDDSQLSRRMPVGSPLEVRVTTAERENVLTVPVGLLTADSDGHPALLTSNVDSDPVLTRVEVGLVAEGYVEILAGVGPETQILVPLR